MENNTGKQQGELCAELRGSAASRVQPATPRPERPHIERATGLRNAPRLREEKRYQYLSSLLPLTVTRSFHVPGVVFTPPRSLSRGDGGFCSAASRGVLRPARGTAETGPRGREAALFAPQAFMLWL